MELDLNPRVLNLLSRQVVKLQQCPPEGIEPIVNEEDITDIHAWVSGPQSTPYYQGKFRCRLEITAEFPNVPPKGYFLTRIFHPNIAIGGEICVNTLKKDWSPKNWSLSYVFQTIRCLLIEPFPESALNEEAGRMFMEDYDMYFKHATLYTSVHAMPRHIQSITPQTQTQVEKIRKWLKRV